MSGLRLWRCPWGERGGGRTGRFSAGSNACPGCWSPLGSLLQGFFLGHKYRHGPSTGQDTQLIPTHLEVLSASPPLAQPLWGNGAASQLQAAKNRQVWVMDLDSGSKSKVLLQGSLNKGVPSQGQEPGRAQGSDWKLEFPLTVRSQAGF